jgi:hypothetical protein
MMMRGRGEEEEAKGGLARHATDTGGRKERNNGSDGKPKEKRRDGGIGKEEEEVGERWVG